MFLPFAGGTRSTHKRQFDVVSKRYLFWFGLAPSPRSVPVCTFNRPRHFAPPRRAVVQFLRQSAEPCAAPTTSPFMALWMDPRDVKAHARFPRCSSVCGCILFCKTAQRFRRSSLLNQQKTSACFVEFATFAAMLYCLLCRLMFPLCIL